MPRGFQSICAITTLIQTITLNRASRQISNATQFAGIKNMLSPFGDNHISHISGKCAYLHTH